MGRVTKRVQTALDQAAATHALARSHETEYQTLVLAALARVAGSFVDLIAAGKPVDPAEIAHLKTLWGRQIPDLAAASARIYQTAGNEIAKPVGGSITAQLRDQYLRNSANRLADVGDDLWAEASGSLADGAAAGEGYEQLTARLVDLFTKNNATIGESRASLISRTEVASAVNGGGWDAMQQSDTPPTYRCWICSLDDRVRESHYEADGQIVGLDEPFLVDGEELAYPGDPNADISLTANCRCTTIYTDEVFELPLEGRQFRSDEEIAAVVDKFAEKGVTRSPGLLASAGTVSENQGADVSDPSIAAAAIMDPEIVFTTARIRALTLLDVSAFEEAQIQLDGPPDADGFAPFSGVATLENVTTGDGRHWDANAFRWEDGSQPFEWAPEFGSHDGAVCIGRVDQYTRDGNLIRCTGVVDTTAPLGQTAYDMIDRGLLRWVSVVMDDIPENTVEYPEDEPMPDDPMIDAPMLPAAGVLAAPISFPAGTPLAHLANTFTALAAAATPADAETAASASYDTDLPIAPEGTDWDPDLAHANLITAATDADGDLDPALMAAGHLWFLDGADEGDPESYRLPFADVIEGVTQAVPAGLDWASSAAIDAHDNGDMPDTDFTAATDRLGVYYERLAADDDTLNGGAPADIEASAWSEFRQMPVLSPALFAEPDLSLEGEWFHYDAASSRIYGWVAQANVCHDAFSNACVTAPLGSVDLAHFNRQPIELADGTTVMAGAFTMAAGHGNDGADAQTMTALFDDTRTVAGIVTVGVKADGSGMWFSGVAAPWLSDWDTQVLAACRPSGHWRRTASGGYSLRAVLSVPVPGFPNRVAASAVVDRANLTLVASAAITADPEPVTAWGVMETVDDGVLADPNVIRLIASAVADEIEQREHIRAEVAALSESLADERRIVAAGITLD